SFLVLFLFIRLTGKRTLANLSAFDFVVIIALGSILAEMMLGTIPLVEGTAALTIVLVFQFGLAWGARKSKKVEDVVNTKPTLLFIDGEFLHDKMDKEMITRDEIYSGIRTAGIYDLDEIKAIVLELNGHVSIVKKSDVENPTNNSLEEVLRNHD
ncbi:MAG: DUF421 domain-containing protein, partial [Proteobacteria bacterium]